MNPITSILDRYPALIIDGALATELERRGCDLKDDLWSAKILLEQPAKVKQVHFDYYKAGADCAGDYLAAAGGSFGAAQTLPRSGPIIVWGRSRPAAWI